MKSVVNRIIIALLLVTMISVAAFAKSKKTNVTFTVDTRVNETLVNHETNLHLDSGWFEVRSC